MPVPSKFDEIEAREKRPMRDLLPELFTELGSQRAVARRLGVNQSTLYTWLLKLGLEQKTILVPRGGDCRQPAS
jgi:transposase-like protein